MKALFILVIAFLSSISMAGTNSGGGGVRPQTGLQIFNDEFGFLGDLNSVRAMEMIKLVAADTSGKVIFNYKPAGQIRTQIHSAELSEFVSKYLEALKRSQLGSRRGSFTFGVY